MYLHVFTTCFFDVGSPYSLLSFFMVDGSLVRCSFGAEFVSSLIGDLLFVSNLVYGSICHGLNVDKRCVTFLTPSSAR